MGCAGDRFFGLLAYFDGAQALAQEDGRHPETLTSTPGQGPSLLHRRRYLLLHYVS